MDTISRAAAIDAIMADKIEGKTLDIIIALGDGNQAKTLNEACDRHAQLLKDLPSAQSEVAKDINVPNNDTISRQAAIDALRMDIDIIPFAKAREYARAVIETVYNRLNDLPSAQPEYYDYSDIDLVWKYYAEEQDIKLTDGAKQLKDAMWVGYRKGKQDAQPEWIPCSERLPKEDDQYLITEKGTFGDYLYVSIANYGVPLMPMNKGKGRGWFITDSEGDYYCDMNHVLAWMPLPEPYKGEQP